MKTETMKSSLRTTNPPVILLVEDESAVREVTREVLLHAGYQVLESSCAKEALQLATARAGHVDLLLTDVIMPEMNGADLAGQLQNMLPDLVTVFMSGYAESDVARKIHRTSGTHIQKPFTVQTLLARVAEALRAGSGGSHGVAKRDGKTGLSREYDAEAEPELVPMRHREVDALT